MSVPPISDVTWDLYRAAVVEIDLPEGWIDTSRGGHHTSRTLYVITADDPESSGDRSQDEANLEGLHTDLLTVTDEVFPAVGRDSENLHRERGWAAACSEDEALTLGRKYHQNAIFRLHGDTLVLVDCSGRRPESVVSVRGSA